MKLTYADLEHTLNLAAIELDAAEAKLAAILAWPVMLPVAGGYRLVRKGKGWNRKRR